MNRCVVRTFLALGVIAAIQGFVLAETVDDCPVCSMDGSTPKIGTASGGCYTLPQNEPVGGPFRRTLYVAPSAQINCAKEDPMNPGQFILCSVALCCDPGDAGYFFCNLTYNAATCESTDECAGKCCPVGPLVIETDVEGCPGKKNKMLACEPL